MSADFDQSEFTQIAETHKLVAEASTLGLARVPAAVSIQMDKIRTFAHIDTIRDHEGDVCGWEYEAPRGEHDWTLVIFND